MKKVIVGLAVIAISLGVSINSFAASSKPTPASGGMKMDMPKPSTPPLTGKAAKAGGTILDAPIPSSILSIPLQDVNGKTFTLGSLKGSPSDLASLWKFFGVFTKIDTATKGLLDWQTG